MVVLLNLRKKISVTFILTALIISNISAQRKITGKVTYDCYVNIGMGVSNFEANLFFNRDSSYFQTVNKPSANDTTTFLQKDKILESKVSIGIKDTIGFKIITDKRSKIIYSREVLLNKMIPIYETIPNFQWVIHEDIKLVGKNICQKATCSFRNRNYIAWFAKDISLDAGPYKFQGLPGLILEVTDDLGKISFIMKDVSIPYTKEIPISSIYIPKPMQRADYVIIAKKSVDQLTKYLLSSSRTENTGKIKVKGTIISIEDLDVPN